MCGWSVSRCIISVGGCGKCCAKLLSVGVCCMPCISQCVLANTSASSFHGWYECPGTWCIVMLCEVAACLKRTCAIRVMGSSECVNCTKKWIADSESVWISLGVLGGSCRQ